MSTWLITGASRGLGAHIAHHALAAGHNVVATARKAEAVTAALADAGPGRLLACSLDVHDPAPARAAVAAAQERFGRVDVVVNNAGRDLSGPSRRSPTPKHAPCSIPTSSAPSTSCAPSCPVCGPTAAAT
jgi:NAD(P)-dependent dehydrogenase (short-subunit alcohol dehydrogenase family)